MGLHGFDSVLDLARSLIEIKSLSGSEEEAVRHCCAEAKKIGMDCYVDGMGNFVGTVIVGDGSGPRILLSGHLDTVNAHLADWSSETPPFKAVERDGRLYGRGASDMKSSLAAMFYAAASCSSLGDDFSGTIHIVAGPLEEQLEAICLKQALADLKPDFVIIGEPSSNKVAIAQRGRAELVIRVKGRSVHASIGKTTVNPIEEAGKVIVALDKWQSQDRDDLLGERSLVATDVVIPVGGGAGLDGRGGNSTVPRFVDLTYDIRIIPGDTQESIKALIEKNLEGVVAPSVYELSFRQVSCRNWNGVEINSPSFIPAWRGSVEDELVIKARKGLKAASKSFETTVYHFCTDGSAIVEWQKVNPCQIIGYGPSNAKLLHIADEYIDLNELAESYDGFKAIIFELLRK